LLARKRLDVNAVRRGRRTIHADQLKPAASAGTYRSNDFANIAAGPKNEMRLFGRIAVAELVVCHDVSRAEFGKTAAMHSPMKPTWSSLPRFWSIDPLRLSEEDHPLGLGQAARLPENLVR
jgi:hypothetical protein